MPPPFGTAYASPQYELGIAKETTKGTGVAPAFWMKIKNPKWKPELVLINDDTLQGAMVKVYDLVPGMRHDTHGWEGYPYLDTYPLLNMGLLGSTDTLQVAPANTTLSAPAVAGATTIPTAASIAAGSWIVIGTGSAMEVHQTQAVSGAGPFTVTLSQNGLGFPLQNAQINGATVTGLTGHKFSLLNNVGGTGNQPPAMTLTDFDGEEWRQWAAGQLNKLTVKGTSTGLVDYNVDWLANAYVTPTTPTPSFSSEPTAPGWTSMLAIGGTQVKYYTNWQLDFARNVKPVPALTGTQSYFALFADAIETTGKVTVLLQSGQPEIAQFQAGTQQTFDLVFYDLKSGWAQNYHSSKCQFKTAARNVGGQPWVEVELDLQFLPTTTDATAGGVSPLTATTANAQTAAF